MADGVTPADDSNRSETQPLIPADDSHRSETETLIFNIGGVIFETYRSTLLQIPNGPLADNNILTKHFRPERNDYFFDKDPDAFKMVINTLRTGKFTFPVYIVDPYLKAELVFWGLTPDTEQPGNTNTTQVPESIGTYVIAGTSRGCTDQEGTGDKIWNLLSNPTSSMLAKLYAGLSYFLMFVSVIILVTSTTSMFHATGANSTQYQDMHGEKTRIEARKNVVVDIVALVICLFFMIEYTLRVVFAPNRFRFVGSFLGVVDLLAVLPEFITIVILLSSANLKSLRVLRILAVFRILRALRIFKHFNTMMGTKIIVNTLKSCFGELMLLFGLAAIGVLVVGTLAYYFENEDEINGIVFQSIPEACWWAVVTMTTVGYGDIFPMTSQGKILASFCAMSGLLVIGLLVSVLVNNMIKVCSKEMQAKEKRK